MERRRRRPCPLCGSPQGRVLHQVVRGNGRLERWTVARCPECRMVYLAEELSYEDQAEDYDWSETVRLESDRRDREAPSVRYVRRGLRGLKERFGRQPRARTAQLVLRHRREGRLCDFGCGAGDLLVLLSPYFSVCGIDISESLAAEARKRLPHAEILVSPVTCARLPAETFDVVTMQSYLEHEQHPVLALQVAFHALKGGGIIVLKTPNYGSWNRRIRARNWCGFRFPDHCNYFTQATLHLALEKTGFVPLRGSLFDCIPTSDNMYASARKAQRRPSRLVGKHARPEVEEIYEPALDRRHLGKAA